MANSYDPNQNNPYGNTYQNQGQYGGDYPQQYGQPGGMYNGQQGNYNQMYQQQMNQQQMNRGMFGLNQQGTEIVRPSMYCNKYPWEKAKDLFGKVNNYGAQLPK